MDPLLVIVFVLALSNTALGVLYYNAHQTIRVLADRVIRLGRLKTRPIGYKND